MNIINLIHIGDEVNRIARSLNKQALRPLGYVVVSKEDKND